MGRFINYGLTVTHSEIRSQNKNSFNIGHWLYWFRPILGITGFQRWARTGRPLWNGPWCEKTCLQGIENNTGADQPAHPRSRISAFDIRFLKSIISRLATSEISNFKLVSVAEETGLKLALSETLKTRFVVSRPKYEYFVYRHGNKYDDVDVTINEQRQIGYPNETRTYQNKQRQIGYPNERRTYQNQDTTR